MGETLGDGKVEKTSPADHKKYKYLLNIFDKDSQNRPTRATIEQVLANFKADADANGLTVEIERSSSDIL